MLKVTNLHKIYRLGESEIEVLRGLDLTVERGEFVSIVGASGTGKSTLLHLLGGLDHPEQGRIEVDGEAVTGIGEKQVALLRNSKIGFVFQFHHLLPEFTALENVMMPMRIGRMAENAARDIAAERLREVGMEHRLAHLPNQLSGGERQRVAFARALASDPSLLLMDEPTGNLDPKSAGALFSLVKDLQKGKRLTIIMVTHNMSLADETDRCLTLQDGRLVPLAEAVA
jgi:lipoprotein-releasing system ATP-binding protein